MLRVTYLISYSGTIGFSRYGRVDLCQGVDTQDIVRFAYCPKLRSESIVDKTKLCLQAMIEILNTKVGWCALDTTRRLVYGSKFPYTVACHRFPACP